MRRLLPAALLTGALVLAAPVAAFAHVHVDPVQAGAGEATDLAFSVPNESDSATTTGVVITIPAGLGDMEAKPVTGWTVRTTATSVAYTAVGDGIGQGASQQFVVHVAAVPAVGSLLIPVAQTYSDGTVVDWDEPTPATGEEPEHPAPTLYVQDDPPAEHDEAEEHGTEAAAAAAPVDLSLPIALSAAALVVALGALAVGVIALLRRR